MNKPLSVEDFTELLLDYGAYRIALFHCVQQGDFDTYKSLQERIEKVKAAIITAYIGKEQNETPIP
jgi:hypothetical protein